MEIRIFGTVDDSIVDGPGYRYSIFVQGCPHNCPGCHNPESHDFSGGRIVDTDDIAAQFTANPLLDGITLSGGEPMCKPKECLQLALIAKQHNMTVWCYTGYTIEKLFEENDPDRMALLDNIDVLVEGPFILAQRSLELKFCGSRNQRLVDIKASKAQGRIVLWQSPSWDVE